MGDFDRVEKTSPAADSKKVGMVVALGAGFLAVVGYQMMKHGPQPANAAVPGGLSGMEGVEIIETPAILRQSLAADPTTILLQANQAAHPALQPIRNPFRMGNTWLSSLHQAPPVRPVEVGVKPQPRPVFVDPVVPVAVRAEDYKLNSIVNGGGGMSAIINGKVLHAGDVIGKARVIQINGQEVVLQHIDFPDGPTTTLSLQRRLNQP